MLQVSAGFSYTWDAAAPVGSGVNPSSIAIDGVAIEPGGPYRIAVNSYLADGGSGFSVLEEGSARNGGGIDLDALAAYFAKAGAVAPGPRDSITRLN
jgi:5'-nucleotidase